MTNKKNEVELSKMLKEGLLDMQKVKELKAIYEHLPEYWQKLKDMQDKTAIPFRDGESDC